MTTEVLGQILTNGPRVTMTLRQSQAQVRVCVRVVRQSESRVCETQKVGVRGHETDPEVIFLISDRSFAFGSEQFWNSVGGSRSRVWLALGLQTVWRLVCCLSCHAALRWVPHLDKPGSQRIRQANRGERKLIVITNDLHEHNMCYQMVGVTRPIEFHFKNLRHSQHRCFPLKWRLGRE